MLRDLKFARRNSGKHEEIENVDPSNSCAAQSFAEGSRPPLNTIQDPHDAIPQSKIERTPSKANNKRGSELLRTPDKRHRFGWAQKNDAVSSLYDDRRGSGVGNGCLVTVATTPRVPRSVGRGGGCGGGGAAAAACSESNSTQSTPTKSVTKPPSSSIRNKADGNLSVRLGNYAALYKGVSVTPTFVNTVEVPHFDLKEDSSFWINHNVQVSELGSVCFIF